MAESSRITLFDRGLTALDDATLQSLGTCTELDLSDNSLRTPRGFERLPQLTSLILDNNCLSDSFFADFPVCPNLQTLCVNGNHITDLCSFLEQVQRFAPRLTYLSMLKNECCPRLVSILETDQNAYPRYRLHVIHTLRTLTFLDSTPITDNEREEALRVGDLMRVQKAVPVQPPATAPLDDGLLADHEAAHVFDSDPKNSAFFGTRRYRYDGSQSEGNRYIVNSDL
eukprot:gnl/Spiro4/11808_TR6237_c0_g1_i1.p1 gnl/Spiro4/11808_TR6237_c0_g1~~gnl/Spiro4/11808_TR6237_c0_g1_i1.p1  ORF type:complete len:240 (-),score=46.59 gnl/Spiro4/11808_TR6237_c0_g1_i1:33-713(-)